jgi:hypothetical protein
LEYVDLRTQNRIYYKLKDNNNDNQAEKKEKALLEK